MASERCRVQDVIGKTSKNDKSYWLIDIGVGDKLFCWDGGYAQKLRAACEDGETVIIDVDRTEKDGKTFANVKGVAKDQGQQVSSVSGLAAIAPTVPLPGSAATGAANTPTSDAVLRTAALRAAVTIAGTDLDLADVSATARRIYQWLKEEGEG